MTDRYVDPSVGTSGAGTSWATAYKTLGEAAAAAAAGEKIYFHNGTPDVITTNKIFTLATGVSIISTSDSTNNPPQTYAAGATVSSITAGVDINIDGKGSIFGVTFSAGTTLTSTLFIASADNSVLYLEGCTFHASSSSGQIKIGDDSVRIKCRVMTRNCTWKWGRTDSPLQVACQWDSDGDSFAPTGSVPSTLIAPNSDNNAPIRIAGANLSTISGTLISGTVGATQSAPYVNISNSKLHASVTVVSAITQGYGVDVTLTDCSYMNGSTLTGKLFYHENYYGATTISTAIYNNASGSTIDGTTKVSWVVDGKSTAAFGLPYQSPWIAAYTAGGSAVTPKFEVVRDGSASAYTCDQVWAEFEYRATADSAHYTLEISDRFGILSASAAAAQDTGALGASDWTGEGGTAWFGKLNPSASITPAEVGYVRGRICVGGDFTVYVDPQILGL